MSYVVFFFLSQHSLSKETKGLFCSSLMGLTHTKKILFIEYFESATKMQNISSQKCLDPKI